MASALTSPYKDDTLAEVVPNVAKIAGKLAQSSVITDRRRVRIVPQSGQTYSLGAGGTGTVNFLIQDGQAYADLQTANISFSVTIQGAASNTAILDDGAWSVFRRALVSVNSTQADDIDRVAVRANQEIYSTCSQSWYDGPGSLMGLWKHGINGIATAVASNPVGKDVVASKYNPLVKALTEVSASQNAAAATTRYSFPVSLLSHFFRSEMLYPCRNAGQLYLQLQLASAAEAAFSFVSASGVAAAAPTVTISDVTLEMDYVTLHPSYLEMMDKLMAGTMEDGVMWAYDAHTVGSGILSAAAGDQSVVYTKASQNLRALHVVAQPQVAGSATGAFGNQSTFCNPGCVNIQTRAGSLYFPAFQSIGNARMAMDLFESFGSPAAVDKASIVDNNNYNAYSEPAAAALTAASTVNTDGVLAAGLNQRANSDAWSWGYCYDRLKRAKLEGADLDGINTLSTSGSQIVVQIGTGTLPSAAVLTGILRYTRILKLHGGSTQILG
jgi:hypothetical protein